MTNPVQTLKGFLRPARRNNGTPPDWHREFSFGWNPQYPTFCSVFLRRATLEYPKRAAFIQLNNAAGSCYCKLDSPNTLHTIAVQLAELAQSAETAWQELAHTELEAQAGIAAFCQAAGIAYDPNDPQIVRQIRDMRKVMECSPLPNGGPPTAPAQQETEPPTVKSPQLSATTDVSSPIAEDAEMPVSSPQESSDSRHQKGGGRLSKQAAQSSGTR